MHAVAMKAALRCHSLSLCPHTELPEIHSFSIIQYWLLIVILIPCLLVLLHILWCRLVCRNSVELNFVKTGLKSKFEVDPQFFFSWAVSVHNEIKPYCSCCVIIHLSASSFPVSLPARDGSWAGPWNEATSIIPVRLICSWTVVLYIRVWSDMCGLLRSIRQATAVQRVGQSLMYGRVIYRLLALCSSSLVGLY